jgi:transposase InsO family protein
MSPAPGSYYDRPKPRSVEAAAEEVRLVGRIRAIGAAVPRDGYRRVTAPLKAEGEPVDHKRVARIRREPDLRVRPKRRFVVTTGGDHDGPIFPNGAKGTVLTGPDQLWVAGLTSSRILSGFVDLAVILDAWSRRVVGWAMAGGSTPTWRWPHWRQRSPPGNRRRAACAIPIAAPGTPPGRTAGSSRGMGSAARWAGAATRTMTPRRRAP